MPMYRFKCRSCEEEFTTLCSIGKENEVRCKSCASKNVQRLLPCTFVGKTSTGKRLTGSACGSCTAASCQGCSR